MGFLTNLLPGVRDLRTPLITGYTWLLGLWLWSMTFRSLGNARNQVGEIFAPLTSYYGRVVSGAAISVAAFLVGSLITVDANRLGTFRHERLLTALYQPVVARLPYLRHGRVGFRKPRSVWTRITTDISHRYRLRRPDIDRLFSYLLNDSAVEEDLRYRTKIGPGVDWRYSLRIEEEDLVRETLNTLAALDAPTLSIRLHIRNAELWNQYDRLIAEAELRLSLALPVLFGGIGLALRMGNRFYGPFVALVVAGFVYAAGLIRARMANGVLMQCLITGVMTDPRVDVARGVVRSQDESEATEDALVAHPQTLESQPTVTDRSE